MAFKINFTAHGEHVTTWPGYASYAEARAALRDADLIIPFHWDHDITEDAAPGPAPRFDYENACPECGPTCEC